MHRFQRNTCQSQSFRHSCFGFRLQLATAASSSQQQSKNCFVYDFNANLLENMKTAAHSFVTTYDYPCGCACPYFPSHRPRVSIDWHRKVNTSLTTGAVRFRAWAVWWNRCRIDASNQLQWKIINCNFRTQSSSQSVSKSDACLCVVAVLRWPLMIFQFLL